MAVRVAVIAIDERWTSGDFLPKREEETPEGALWVCFDAILWRGTAEEESGRDVKF